MAGVEKNLLNETTYWSHLTTNKTQVVVCHIESLYNSYQTWYKRFPLKNILFWYVHLFTTVERSAVKTLLLEKNVKV